jgi:hypothetical protein
MINQWKIKKSMQLTNPGSQISIARMGNGSQTEIEAFWSDVEKELGEKVLIKSLGRCFTPPEPAVQPEWGLFYLTRSFFCFRHFRQENWLSGLLRSPDRHSGQSSYTIRLCRASVRRIEVIAEKNWWRRFFLAPPPLVKLEYTGEHDEKMEFRFSAEKDHEALIDALRL